MKALALITVFLFASANYAQNDTAIPKPLEAWKDWAVRKNLKQVYCPQFDGYFECVWPGLVELDVNDAGGRFHMFVKAMVDIEVPIPGGPGMWPDGVTVNGEAVPVLMKDGKPVVYLKAGDRRIWGRFQWDSLPETLTVPDSIGMIRFKRFGELEERPYRQNGRLLLNAQFRDEEEEEVEANSLRLHVWRVLKDAEPMILETALMLDTSGEERELDLGKAVPEGFIVYEVESNLPWRFVEDRLQVQSDPGREVVVLRAFALDSAVLGPVRPIDEWPLQERWFFEADSSLRSVVIKGGAPLDATRFEVPDALEVEGSLPLYGLGTEDRLILDERTRGLAQVPPDVVRLNRSLWLDFDGDGYTFRDELFGTLEDVWRLEMASPYDLGAVRLNGAPELITVLKEGDNPGVNLANRSLNLIAEGRLESGHKMPVVGWDATLSEVRYSVFIPASYKPVMALGADQSRGTWMDSWNVWDFFWVLLMAMITSKLFSKRLGLLALVVMTLLHGEIGAPLALWFPLLAMIAIERVAKASWKPRIRKVFYLCLILLLIQAIPFIRNQAMWALYPESSSQRTRYGPTKLYRISDDGGSQTSNLDFAIQPEAASAPKATKQAASNTYMMDQALRVQSVEQNRAQIQTGPGLPKWHAREVALEWSGPISNEAEVRLITLSPGWSRLVTLLRIASMLALLAALCGWRPRGGGMKVGKAGAVGLLAFLALGSAQAQEIPDQTTLKELAEHLARPADCFPNCASVPKAHLVRKGDFWQVQMTVHAGARTAIALPKETNRATLNGKMPYLIRKRAGKQLLMMVDEGLHQVNIDLYGRSYLYLDFPMKPLKLTWQEAEGWTLEGVDDSGRITETPYLEYSSDSEEETEEESWEGTDLPAFATVVRTLSAGQTWDIKTEIEVWSEAPFRGRIPLLKGERFLEEDVQIEDGVLLANVDGFEDLTLKSRLEPTTQLAWKHPEGARYQVEWRLEVDPIWYTNWEGVPTIRYFDGSNKFSPSWTPRPGESLNMTFDRPKASHGIAFTYEAATIYVNPGVRMTNYGIELKYQSAIGGEQAIRLPEGAEVRLVQLDGVQQPIRMEPEGLILRHEPGRGKLEVFFSLNEGLSSSFSPASIDLGHPAVNLKVEMEMASNRWVLMAFGPGNGPIIMFWSILLVVLLGAFVLNRFQFGMIGLLGWILLGLGLSQLHIYSSVIAVTWFALVKNSGNRETSGMLYNLGQLLILVMTFAFGIILLAVLYQGLLSNPNMYIHNWYPGEHLNWFLDRFDGTLPEYTVVSVPMWVYRLLMFGWALWLASAMPKWIRAAWDGFSARGVFQRRRVVPTPAPEAAPSPEASDADAGDGSEGDDEVDPFAPEK